MEAEAQGYPLRFNRLCRYEVTPVVLVAGLDGSWAVNAELTGILGEEDPGFEPL